MNKKANLFTFKNICQIAPIIISIIAMFVSIYFATKSNKYSKQANYYASQANKYMKIQYEESRARFSIQKLRLGKLDFSQKPNAFIFDIKNIGERAAKNLIVEMTVFTKNKSNELNGLYFHEKLINQLHPGATTTFEFKYKEFKELNVNPYYFHFILKYSDSETGKEYIELPYYFTWHGIKKGKYSTKLFHLSSEEMINSINKVINNK
jgi:hypothetical protein